MNVLSRKACLVILMSWFGCVFAQNWQQATDGFFTVETASPADAEKLREVFDSLEQAAKDLKNSGFVLPDTVTVRVHPTLESFQNDTDLPWFVAALADRKTDILHTQRLWVLLERHSLEKTLRHEMFHLAQPADWPRWQAEGAAMHFAGERPQAQPLPGLSDEQLDALLAAPPSAELLARAVATAYARVQTRRAFTPAR